MEAFGEIKGRKYGVVGGDEGLLPLGGGLTGGQLSRPGPMPALVPHPGPPPVSELAAAARSFPAGPLSAASGAAAS